MQDRLPTYCESAACGASDTAGYKYLFTLIKIAYIIDIVGISAASCIQNVRCGSISVKLARIHCSHNM